MDIGNRIYFIANACHVCKSKSTPLSCEICQMVFYCSADHKRNNWFDHSELCWALNKICESGKCDFLWELANGENFTDFRHEVAIKCTKLLKRSLKPWEFEMIYYPRVCDVCHEFNWKKLSCCKSCEFVYTCEKAHFRKDHRNWCKTMKLYSDVIICLSVSDNNHVKPLEVKVKSKGYNSIADVFAQNCERKEKYENYEIREALISEVLTYPLTVYQSLKAIGALKGRKLVILFIGAEIQAEVEPLNKWEKYLFHFLPDVEFLNLKFLGPELQETDREFSGDLCEICSGTSCRAFGLLFHIALDFLNPICPVTANKRQMKDMILFFSKEKQGKNLKFQYITGKFYHEYSSNKISQPNLICAMNSGMYRDFGFGNENSWENTIEALFAQGNPPLLVTEYTSHEMNLDLKRIKGLCKGVNPIVQPGKNPFSSLKPGLNIISENENPVIFKNYFYTILQNK